MLHPVRIFILSALVVVSSLALPALAQSEPFEQDLVVTPLTENASPAEILTGQEPGLESEEFKVIYDPKDFADETGPFESKEKILKSLYEEMKETRDVNELYIPRAPVDEAQWKKIVSLREEELQAFLSKKQKFLSGVAKFLSALHLSPKFVNKILAELNVKFYNSSHVIAQSNSKGGTVTFSLAGGLALPKKITEKIRQRPLGRFLPKTGGFSFLIGLGVGLSRTQQEDGRHSWVLEVFMDTEKLKTTLTGIFKFSAAANFGYVYERREGRFKSQKTSAAYGGIGGVFRQGPHQFSWDANFGLTSVSIPPLIGAGLIYTNESTRRYLVRLDFSKLFRKNPSARLCAEIF